MTTATLREQALALRRQGFLVREIGIIMDLSPRRVYAIIRNRKPVAEDSDTESPPEVVALQPEWLPLDTLVGTVHAMPIRADANDGHNCTHCSHERECHQAVCRGDPVRCEQILVSELLPQHQEAIRG